MVYDYLGQIKTTGQELIKDVYGNVYATQQGVNPQQIQLTETFIRTHTIVPFTDLSDAETLGSSLAQVYDLTFNADTILTRISLLPSGSNVKAYVVFSGSGWTMFVPTKAQSTLKPVSVQSTTNFEFPSGFGVLIPANTTMYLMALQSSGTGGTIQVALTGYTVT